MSGDHRARLDRLSVVYERRQPARRDRSDLDYLRSLTMREQYRLYLLLTILDPDGPEPAREWSPDEAAQIDELIGLARARSADGVDFGNLSWEEREEFDKLLAVERPLPGEGPARRWTPWERLRSDELHEKTRGG